jgi:hypothetical protein
MRPPKGMAKSLYFSPSRDALPLSMDYTDNQYYSDELKRLYNRQFNHIKTVLVSDRNWVDTTPAECIRKFLTIFGCLEIIRLLHLQSHHRDEDGYSDDHHNIHNTCKLNVERLHRYAN